MALGRVKDLEVYKRLIESYGTKFLMSPKQIERFAKDKDLKNGAKLVRIAEELIDELKSI